MDKLKIAFFDAKEYDRQAFLTNEALSNIADTTLQNIRDFFGTGLCANEVCYKCANISKCNQKHAQKCF